MFGPRGRYTLDHASLAGIRAPTEISSSAVVYALSCSVSRGAASAGGEPSISASRRRLLVFWSGEEDGRLRVVAPNVTCMSKGKGNGIDRRRKTNGVPQRLFLAPTSFLLSKARACREFRERALLLIFRRLPRNDAHRARAGGLRSACATPSTPRAED